MSMYKVSVVIPIFNVESYLERCVESVIHQTLKDIEIILVDDKSPDRCPAICDAYSLKDSRIKVVHKKQNEGLGFARNSGLEIATGEYVTFLDSDDWVEEQTYDYLYNIVNNKQLDICYFQHRRVDKNGRIIKQVNKNTEKFFYGRKQVDNFLLEMVAPHPSEHLDNKYSMSVCMGIFRTSIIKENAIKFKSERSCASEDLEFHIRLLPFINSVGVIPNVFYNYLMNENSLSSSYNELKLQRMLSFLDLIKTELKELYPDNYEPHYFGQVLRIFKKIIRKECEQSLPLKEKLARIRKICSETRLEALYKSPICHQYALRNRLYIFCIKYKLASIFLLYYKK